MKEANLRKLIRESIERIVSETPNGWGNAFGTEDFGDEEMLDQTFSDEDALDAATDAKRAAMADISDDPETKQWEDPEDIDFQEPAPGEMDAFLRSMRKVSK